MILRNATILYKGYDPDLLSAKSHKRICVSCDQCGRVRYVRKAWYRDLCLSCSTKGSNNPMYDVHRYGKDAPNYKVGNIILICHYCNKDFIVNQSRKTAKFCNKKCEGKWHNENFSGKNNPNYNFDITDEERLIKRQYPEYKQWRTSIFERDNYTCQECNQYGGNLNAHHIESYSNNPDLRISLDNGITLCKDCHKDFHHQYGYGNNSRNQFIEFINGRI